MPIQNTSQTSAFQDQSPDYENISQEFESQFEGYLDNLVKANVQQPFLATVKATKRTEVFYTYDIIVSIKGIAADGNKGIASNIVKEFKNKFPVINDCLRFDKPSAKFFQLRNSFGFKMEFWMDMSRYDNTQKKITGSALVENIINEAYKKPAPGKISAPDNLLSKDEFIKLAPALYGNTKEGESKAQYVPKYDGTQKKKFYYRREEGKKEKVKPIAINSMYTFYRKGIVKEA